MKKPKGLCPNCRRAFDVGDIPNECECGERLYGVVDVAPMFSARESCMMLAALRTVQKIMTDAKTSMEDRHRAAEFAELEHFENSSPLSVEEIDALCERVTIDWLPEIEAREKSSAAIKAWEARA